MDWRVRALTAALMTIVMVALVTLIATWLAVGLDPHFLRQWAKAFAIAWPVAAITAFLVMPTARASGRAHRLRSTIIGMRSANFQDLQPFRELGCIAT